MREVLPGRSANLELAATSATTWRILPRSMRSARSAWVSCVVAGLTTAPSFIAASVISHSGTTFGSMTSMQSPRRTPLARRKFATRLERSLIPAKLSFASEPSSFTTHSAVRELPRAMTSK